MKPLPLSLTRQGAASKLPGRALRYLLLFSISGLALGTLVACGPTAPQLEDGRVPLRPVSDFASISDEGERSQALFMEASRVIMHPRCVNCHPTDDSPRQGDDHQPHVPPVTRGVNGDGIPGLPCTSCHQTQNYDAAGIPGAEHWHLAPIEMAWLGKSAHEICEQLKDPARNGGRDAAALVGHVAQDALVSWGWNPGEGREPVPGDQATFAALVEAWLATGAACPPAGSPPEPTAGAGVGP